MRASLSYCLTSVQGEAEVLHHKGCVTVVKVYKQLPDNDKSAGLSPRIFSSILPNNQHTFIRNDGFGVGLSHTPWGRFSLDNVF